MSEGSSVLRNLIIYIDVDTPGEGERVLVLAALDEEDPRDFGIIIKRDEVAEMRDVIFVGMQGQLHHLRSVGTGEVDRPFYVGQLDVLEFVAEDGGERQQQQGDNFSTYHYLIISPFLRQGKKDGEQSGEEVARVEGGGRNACWADLPPFLLFGRGGCRGFVVPVVGVALCHLVG